MGQSLDLFGQMWKEYAYSDSRYLTSNAFVLCMETVTAVSWPVVAHSIGPLLSKLRSVGARCRSLWPGSSSPPTRFGIRSR